MKLFFLILRVFGLVVTSFKDTQNELDMKHRKANGARLIQYTNQKRKNYAANIQD